MDVKEYRRHRLLGPYEYQASRLKSRSPVLKKGKVTGEKFRGGEEIIPPILEKKTVKCLAKFSDDSSGDEHNVNGTSNQLENWVTKSALPRIYEIQLRYTGKAFLLEVFGFYLCTTCHWHQLNQWKDGSVGTLEDGSGFPKASAAGLFCTDYR